MNKEIKLLENWIAYILAIHYYRRINNTFDKQIFLTGKILCKYHFTETDFLIIHSGNEITTRIELKKAMIMKIKILISIFSPLKLQSLRSQTYEQLKKYE